MSETPEPDRLSGCPHPAETPLLFGQRAAEQGFLSAWAEGRLHHAWLLRGPRGVGKATLAYRMARALIADGPVGGGLFGNAPPPATLDASDEDPVRRRILAGSEPRLRVLRRTVNPKSNLFTVIRVDEVRAVKEFLQLTAADGGWRAVIVDPADEMNPAAANALLKVLEEPPPLTALLLVAHAPARLLPTIRSRCRVLDLRPLEAQDLAAALEQAGKPVSQSETAAVAELAGGSVGRALRLVEGEGLSLYRRMVAAFGSGRAVDRAQMIALADAVSGRGADAAYALAVELLITLVGRLARSAAAGPPPAEAAPGEAALIGTAARSPAQAPMWAEAAARIAATTSHARAVNLDPGQTIIDTFLDLDATLARAGSAT